MTDYPARWDIARYDSPPASCRSLRSSNAKRWTGPAAGSTGFSLRPTGPSPLTPPMIYRINLRNAAKGEKAGPGQPACGRLPQPPTPGAPSTGLFGGSDQG